MKVDIQRHQDTILQFVKDPPEFFRDCKILVTDTDPLICGGTNESSPIVSS